MMLTCYFRSIYIFATFTGCEDGKKKFISNLHVQGYKFGGKLDKFGGKPQKSQVLQTPVFATLCMVFVKSIQ